MKSKFDLKNPIIKKAIEIMQKQAIIALETPQDVEKAIIPIYAIPKTRPHNKPKRKPEQFGSGVLLQIKDHFFILSSTHLFEAFEGFVLLTGSCNGYPIESLSGERYSTGKISEPYLNQLDATVFHIQSDLSEDLKKLAISLDDLEFEDDYENTRPIYLISGFRNKKSNTQGNEVRSKREAFPTIETSKETYNLFNINKMTQFLTEYEDDILVNGRWQKSPKPRGFSGGAVMKIEGTNLINSTLTKPKTRQKLKAIIIEHHREKDNKPGVVISTKMNVYYSMIYQAFPNLFKD